MKDTNLGKVIEKLFLVENWALAILKFINVEVFLSIIVFMNLFQQIYELSLW